jgi:hypothetical protein
MGFGSNKSSVLFHVVREDRDSGLPGLETGTEVARLSRL